MIIGGGQFDPTDVLCIAEELHCITGKQVDVYAACEINAGSAFYDAILEEGVQIACYSVMNRELLIFAKRQKSY